MRLSPGLRFGVGFFAFLLLCSVLFWALSLHEQLGPVQRAIAGGSVALARCTGGDALARGDEIIVSGLILKVNHECTGIFVCLIFTSFVLAYPVSWRARLLGLGAGIPLLLAVNVLRLATLVRIVEIYPAAFFYFHEYVWQGVFMVFVLVGAMAWAESSA